MSYGVKSDRDSAVMVAERELLIAGFNYAEVAAKTGGRVKSISERNRLVHKVDIWEAFKRRIERDGITNRLTAPKEFCSWFTGFFDGEGCIVAFTRPHSRNPDYSEFRLQLRIMIRDDDLDTIRHIQNNLKVGISYRRKGNGNANPAVAWVCERLQDLAEVMIPLLDNHPLHTKKAKEYAIWRPLVIRRYLATLGGYSNRRGVTGDELAAFHDAIHAIGKVRTYTSLAVAD